MSGAALRKWRTAFCPCLRLQLRICCKETNYSNGVQKELITPTGAAIIATLCDSFGPQPPMSVSAIGYGAGTADLEGQPNVVRILIGEAAEETVAGFDEEIAVIEANLDDMNPQIYGYFLEKALAAGALDVYTTPVQMKKIARERCLRSCASRRIRTR